MLAKREDSDCDRRLSNRPEKLNRDVMASSGIVMGDILSWLGCGELEQKKQRAG
jgi:hypothetical protein